MASTSSAMESARRGHCRERVEELERFQVRAHMPRMMIGWRYIKRVDGSRAVCEIMGRRNEAGSEPAWVLRATDGSRREEYATDDALRQEWMRV